MPVHIGLRRPVAGVRRALMGPEGSWRRRQMIVAKGVYVRQHAEQGCTSDTGESHNGPL